MILELRSKEHMLLCYSNQATLEFHFMFDIWLRLSLSYIGLSVFLRVVPFL
jgi:hypothetical protein